MPRRYLGAFLASADRVKNCRVAETCFCFSPLALQQVLPNGDVGVVALSGDFALLQEKGGEGSGPSKKTESRPDLHCLLNGTSGLLGGEGCSSCDPLFFVGLEVVAVGELALPSFRKELDEVVLPICFAAALRQSFRGP